MSNFVWQIKNQSEKVVKFLLNFQFSIYDFQPTQTCAAGGFRIFNFSFVEKLLENGCFANREP